MITQQKYRYPGVRPFETSDRALFFGRDRDVENLLDMILLEKLVVLFGKSGYGKSSLVNAGLLPALESEADCVLVRLGSYIAGQTPKPLEKLQHRLDEALSDGKEATFVRELPLGGTLWQIVKRKQGHSRRNFVLIFDQFEEFFTYPEEQQQAFKGQLAELLYTEVPQTVRNLTDTLNATQQAFVASPFNAKVLVAIRADRMSLLDSMKDKLPAILQKRYELKGLDAGQAREAVEKPARSIAETFASPEFTYSLDALRVIVEKLSTTRVSQPPVIEAFQLQILCEYLEGEVIAGHIAGNCVEPEHFEGRIHKIFEGYYQRLIGKLAPAVQPAVEQLIDEGLLYEDEKTGEARRLSVDADVLVQRFTHRGITHEVLRELENQFLLRREATSTGGFAYEVSHDTLIAPILKSKAERRVREAAERDRREARRRQRSLLMALTVSLLILVGVIGLVGYYFKLTIEARSALFKAEQEKTRAEKALNAFKAEQEAREKMEFNITLRNVEQILKGNNCPPSEINLIIANMKKKYPGDAELKQKIETVQKQLVGCQ